MSESFAAIETREQWLTGLTHALRPAFEEKGSPLPERIRLSCGFTSAGKKGNRIGECWYPGSSGDQSVEIFVKPDRFEPLEVAAIVLHELCHAALGPGKGHGKEFRKLATGLGLTGKMTSTTAGPEAVALLEPICTLLGPYPHAPLGGTSEERKERKSQAKEYVNVTCPSCGYRACAHSASQEIARLTCPVDGEILLTKEERS